MDKALLARVEKQAWFHRYPRGGPLLLFILTSIITLGSVVAIERAETRRREFMLERNITEIASALQRRATENVALLSAGAALFESKDSVASRQFADFAADLQANGNLDGSMGMGWAPRVETYRLSQLEAEIRRLEQADYLVYPRPVARQPFVAPIVYLVPLTSANRRAIGFDMYSDAVRREAMDEAVRIGQPVATGKVHLIQDRGNAGAAGFLIYMPVTDATAEGASAVKGFIYSPFRADEFLDAASELYRDRPVEIAIYDGAVTPERLLAERKVPGESDVSMQRTIEIANRNWIVAIRDKRSAVLSTMSQLTLFFGLLAALLLMHIGRLITKRAVEDREVLEWLSRQAAIRNSLTRELNHRVKNTLANVLSIAALTRRGSKDLDEFSENLTARIRALSATHDLLSQTNWRHAMLGEVIRSELAPYMDGGGDVQVNMDGPEIPLAPNDAMSLGLAIHELATNAAKYGALSEHGGAVHIEWKRISSDRAEVLWRESGGPPVAPPTRRGFGRELIERIVAHELQSKIELEFKREGVECRLQVPVREVAEFNLRSPRR